MTSRYRVSEAVPGSRRRQAISLTRTRPPTRTWFPSQATSRWVSTLCTSPLLVYLSELHHSPSVFRSGIVIDQSRKGGFRFRTVDEIEQKRAQIEKEKAKIAGSETDLDKKGSEEYVESVSV